MTSFPYVSISSVNNKVLIVDLWHSSRLLFEEKRSQISSFCLGCIIYPENTRGRGTDHKCGNTLDEVTQVPNLDHWGNFFLSYVTFSHPFLLPNRTGKLLILKGYDPSEKSLVSVPCIYRSEIKNCKNRVSIFR